MSAFLIKIIASICMLIDHTGAVFPVSTPFILRLIGRIAFPIYAYMIAQGCKHTKNINKYLLRLGIFALISEIPFDIAFKRYTMDGVLNLNINFFAETNVFYTLFLGAACIAIYERVKTKKRPLLALVPLLIIPAAVIPAFIFQDMISWRILLSIGFLIYLAVELFLSHCLPESEASGKIMLSRKILSLILTVPVFMLGSILDTDYGMYGVIFILFFYLMKPENRITRTIAMVCVVFLKYGYPYVWTLCNEHGINLFTLPGQMMFLENSFAPFCFAFAAVPFVFLYNGKQGPKIKWAFYAFYPVHIAVLAASWFVFERL